MENKSIKANTNKFIILALTIFSFFMALIHLKFSQYEDQGIWLSVFSFLAHGKSLYLNVYDNKDPLFLLTGAGFFKTFGLYGPFLADLIFIALIPMLAYKISLLYKLSVTQALVVSIILLYIITGSYYDGLRSQLPGIFFVFLATYYACVNLPFLAGIFAVVVLGYKFPFVAFCIPSFLIIIANRYKLGSNLFKYFSGVLLGATGLTIIIYAFSDINSYLDVIYENYVYSSNFLGALGRKGGLVGHLEIINEYTIGFKSLFALYILSIFILILNRPPNKENLNHYAISILPLLVLIYLMMTGMWPHHMYVLVLYAWPLLLFYTEFIFLTLNRVYKFKEAFFLLLYIFLLLLISYASGFSVNINMVAKLKDFQSFRFIQPPEIIALKSIRDPNYPATFARLGANDDLALGAFIGDDWNLVCPRFAQFGNESENAIENILDCINLTPQYLIVSPSFYEIKRFSGTYESFRHRALTIIENKFSCIEINDRKTALVCKRF